MHPRLQNCLGEQKMSPMGTEPKREHSKTSFSSAPFFEGTTNPPERAKGLKKYREGFFNVVGTVGDYDSSDHRFAFGKNPRFLQQGQVAKRRRPIWIVTES